tara:strand:- start:1989 stop:2432 length:444 start_codon:yes stop_codon:yes gene_type:complete
MFFKKKKKNEESSSEDTNSTQEVTETASTNKDGEDTAMSENTNVEETAATETEATSATDTENLTVPAEELEILNRYRVAGEDCIKELGNMEIRKARIIASYGQLEQASQQKLMQIGKDLGIAEGTGWSVNPDGSVVINSVATADESE